MGRCEEEMEEDLMWSQSRPAVLRAKAAAVEAVEAADAATSGNQWEEALTDFEKRSLAAYRLNWPRMAYSLTQNGASGFAMHSTPDCLHTLIRNLGLVWNDVLASGRIGTHIIFTKF